MQVIVEDADGEVIKTYDLPSDKPEAAKTHLLVDQGLKYIGLGGARKAGEPSKEGGEGEEAAPDAEAEDDKHIRFTIGGEGRRLTKEDFCRQMQQLDTKTRKEVVAKSDASPAVKRLATQERAGPQAWAAAPAVVPEGSTAKKTGGKK
ncbi:MAG: hypothetical protein IMZ46_09660, partial [Acidobacteria bacterium]|nr:hypothetical protein [Acidobacteriota bacterium]